MIVGATILVALQGPSINRSATTKSDIADAGIANF